MACDQFLELLSARLDGALTEEEERELEEHLAACPDCRAVGAQLSALQGAFPELEEIPAPEGFTRGVMDRIRASEAPKIIPLWKRPQVRALVGLAACLVLAVGLYGAGQPKKQADWDTTVRSFNQDALTQETDGAASLEEVPRIAAYSAPEVTYGVTSDMQKAVPNADADSYDGDRAYAEAVLTLERMPEGGWELIPPETFSSPAGLTVSTELMEQLEQLALEQGISVSRVPGPEANNHCLIVILDEES